MQLCRYKKRLTILHVVKLEYYYQTLVYKLILLQWFTATGDWVYTKADRNFEKDQITEVENSKSKKTILILSVLHRTFVL
jgi:hypothetical protein